MCVQIRTPGRHGHRLAAGRFQDSIEGGAELGIAIVQQIPAPIEQSDVRQSHVPRHLPYPMRIRRGRDPQRHTLLDATRMKLGTQ
jgi:hypothetical protein